MITQARLKELLHYDPETGVFTWLVSKSSKAQAGAEAGSVFKNCRANYRRVVIDGVKHQSHRLAWLYVYGKHPKRQIDHIDGDGLNNRINNLRDVTCRENLKNSRLRSNNTSGVSGVYFHKPSGKWQALIFTNSGRKYLGYFVDIKDAIAARKGAEIEHGYHDNHGQERPL